MMAATKGATMAETLLRTAEVVVDAPDGPAALELEHRLAHLAPVTICHGTHWTVSIPAVRAPAEIQSVVRSWLTDIGADATRVRIDGTPRLVERAPRRRRHVSTNARFIG
jgi:hypothetical protein